MKVKSNPIQFYAHTKEGSPPSEWELLETHLKEVSELAAEFAKSFGAEDWGRLVGWWHDLGKYSNEFQEYLRAQTDPHLGELAGKVDHSSLGAQLAVERIPIWGHILAYAIAGHHSGLLDFYSESASQDARLKKEVFPAQKMSEKLQGLEQKLIVPDALRRAMSCGDHSAFAVSFYTRMLFSCLVDADFLATESFMNPEQSNKRPKLATTILEEMGKALVEKLADFPEPVNEVDRQRARVLRDCNQAADLAPGFFTLTVPTGGGKTLSSLSFALRHAHIYGQKRIVYVAPFTSIIEQNADVYRMVFSDLPEGTLLEHHCALDPKKESLGNRLAAENWDAPMIVTTSVQFYESLFANRTSKVRKLHRLANSVVILDEAQTLPVDYLKPCLDALRELVDGYGTTVVLCTATQPAVKKHEDFEIGLEGVREIVGDVSELFKVLKRTKVERAGKLTNLELAEGIRDERQVLCVVNSRKHAQELYREIGESDVNFHLSALMCPEHRTQKLAQIRQRLHEGKDVRVISTQLVEAGVDLDFPAVYRSMAGLDSIAQAAGRCNRNGLLDELGRVVVFDAEDSGSEKFFQETANVARQVLGLDLDPLSDEAAERYFRMYFYGRRNEWDQFGITSQFSIQQNKDAPFLFQFKSAADDFKIIRSGQISVIIPFDDISKGLLAELRNPSIPLHRNLLRGLQRYTVGIYPHVFYANERDFEWVREEFPVLLCPEQHYSEACGLTLSNERQPNPTLIS